MLSKELHEFYISSPMREGVLCWYPFDSDASVLDMSNGILADLLRSRCKHIVSDNNDNSGLYDYIVILDPQDFSVETLKRLHEVLNPNGRLLLAYENPFALRYWAGKRAPNTGLPYDTLTGKGERRLPSKAELQTRLKQAGFYGQKWYYPLTDHWFAREVYSESYLPNEFFNQRFKPYIIYDENTKFDERKLYREIIREGAFEFMCGAYLVEARVKIDDAPCPVDYVAVTAYREPAKRFATVVRNDNTVHKIPLHKEGLETLQKIKKNHDDLAKLGVNVISLKQENERLIMNRLDLPTLWDYWAKKLTDGTLNYSELAKHFDIIHDDIYKASENGKCYWELVPANCFFDEERNELIFFDQEYYWEDASPDIAMVRALWALQYSSIFASDVCKAEWLEKLKARYHLTKKWDEYSLIADGKTRIEALGTGAAKLEEVTKYANDILEENEKAAVKKVTDLHLRKRRGLIPGKVSMVVPCYNKVDNIEAMLDSVLAQVWDNIEVILVNDGSTDGTREKISQYEPKLKIRGYEVIIIDQVNAGCCAAVYAGLKKMTGDYFCLVDCDDAIEPEYVSKMANWLDENDEYQWTACSYKRIIKDESANDSTSLKEQEFSIPAPQDTSNLIENYILRRVITMAWVYMMRTSYVRECGMLEAFNTERNATYEPCVVVPPAIAAGRLKFFDEPLYIYNVYACDLYKIKNYEDAVKYYGDYLIQYEYVLNKMDIPKEKRDWYILLARYANKIQLGNNINIENGKKYEQSLATETSLVLNEMFSLKHKIEQEYIIKTGYTFLHELVCYRILENELYQKVEKLFKNAKRIIGYGALGKRAQKDLPLIKDTIYEPTVLWDAAADDCHDFLYDIKIEKPNFDSLLKEDIVLIFPRVQSIIDEISMQLSKTKVGAIYYPDDLQELFTLVEYKWLL